MTTSRRMIHLGFDSTPYPAGTHICFLFNDDEEQRSVMARYVEGGLDDREQVHYYVDSVSPAELNEQMRKLGVSLPDEQDGGQCVFVEAEKVYCPDGRFSVGRMLDRLADAHHRSVREGFAGARVTGEMSWSLKDYPGSRDLLEYEARINLLVRDVPTTAVCQYDARLFDGATLYGILSVHPMMIVHGRVVRNPYYLEPEDFLARAQRRSR